MSGRGPVVARELTSVKDYLKMLAGAMPEENLLIAVETEATLAGWRWHHIRRADLAQQQGDPGWPDIVAVRGARIVVAELKAVTGHVFAAQRVWLDAWAAAGAEVYVWRPADLAAIREVLR